MTLDFPHRRYNALTGEWVLVSPHRAQRPWLGQVERLPPEDLPDYDPACYLCPGNARAGGARNPLYSGPFVFDNDFAALKPEAPAASPPESALFRSEPEPGLCRVICFSPRHDLTLPQLSQTAVEQVLATWLAETRDLAARDFIHYVQVFENKGAQMGASNPHPHSQVWASQHVLNEPAKELRTQAAYQAQHGRCLLCDYVGAETHSRTRVVTQNAVAVALVPYWAVWPFEVLVVLRRHVAALTDLTESEVSGLAELLRRVTTRYDNLFEMSFPYSLGFHPAPVDGQAYPTWHLHAHFYPPLLRSATVRKFMVGYELLAMPQRDLTPEQAAERLRSLSDVHYRAR
ncbi:MAG: UDP-glucose--hexose-1-phosphate uridylyltransferase [Anaerolineales bacterium]|nr:UDP-glucose--hexose-1-phosphate uridylyltransferase [Anaerolineales bacterium]